MIYDTLENRALYTNLHPRLSAALDYLQDADLADLLPGRIELDGSRLYVLVQEYEPKPVEEGKWEAHRRYFDVQYMFSGSERCDVALLHTMELGVYDAEKDFQAMSGNGNTLTLSAGQFVVFFPGDAHQPGLSTGQPGRVKKIVLKCLI